MRSGILTAAFAAGALAVPLVERDVVYETDVVYATNYVTVTADAPAVTSQVQSQVEAVAPEPTSTSSSRKHWGHRKPKTWYSSWATTWTEEAAAPSSAEQQKAPAYTSEAPAPSSYDSPSTYEAPSSSAQPTSSAASSASDSKPTDYQGFVVHHHNLHRANHSAPALEWDDQLAETAQNIGNTCSYEHNTKMGPSKDYGQNIAAGVKADNVSAVITELFYNGEVGLYDNLYGQADPDMSQFEQWGHFSQIVWKASTKVGCATVDCTEKGLANTGGNVPAFFTVCNYQSQGNFGGEYADNVERPRGDATCHWNDGM